MRILERLENGLCIWCERPLTEENDTGAACDECSTPEALEARINAMPEPFRSKLLEVGRSIGSLKG